MCGRYTLDGENAEMEMPVILPRELLGAWTSDKAFSAAYLKNTMPRLTRKRV